MLATNVLPLRRDINTCIWRHPTGRRRHTREVFSKKRVCSPVTASFIGGATRDVSRIAAPQGPRAFSVQSTCERSCRNWRWLEPDLRGNYEAVTVADLKVLKPFCTSFSAELNRELWLPALTTVILPNYRFNVVLKCNANIVTPRTESNPWRRDGGRVINGTLIIEKKNNAIYRRAQGLNPWPRLLTFGYAYTNPLSPHHYPYISRRHAMQISSHAKGPFFIGACIRKLALPTFEDGSKWFIRATVRYEKCPIASTCKATMSFKDVQGSKLTLNYFLFAVANLTESKPDSVSVKSYVGMVGEYGVAPECKGGGKREIPRKKTRLLAASSGTIPTCENSVVARPGIEPGSPWDAPSPFPNGWFSAYSGHSIVITIPIPDWLDDSYCSWVSVVVPDNVMVKLQCFIGLSTTSSLVPNLVQQCWYTFPLARDPVGHCEIQISKRNGTRSRPAHAVSRPSIAITLAPDDHNYSTVSMKTVRPTSVSVIEPRKPPGAKKNNAVQHPATELARACQRIMDTQCWSYQVLNGPVRASRTPDRCRTNGLSPGRSANFAKRFQDQLRQYSKYLIVIGRSRVGKCLLTAANKEKNIAVTAIRYLQPLVHTVFDAFWRTLAQSSPSTVTVDSQFAVDIGIFVHRTVEYSLQVIELANFSDL
ncbi:hypothetical protein PR048_023213 [Dryococelus australis]|uniref:Uncharacterized protein n=1 Tax=Dryococelus australis TaxID=614101 RepID=A0ABQ9GTH1_9NEOP|nr:hypothetical protein PR048_023213 [Dryococelus australis]